MRRTSSTHGRNKKCIQILVPKPDGKRPRGNRRHRGEDNIRVGVQETDVDSIQLVQDRVKWRTLVNTVMNLLVV